ncbi:Uncharacterized protein C16C4.16c [Wickerhamiella sorbophila]|uniref:Uncharacterized protein C16C4.16c n=1 Tax=Wickerhamiella sorbophila TaxID=45607 RepID=A0A2T0FEG5_9ASCO|nr:Uncharacterized protein C16C4.16c [Wickerhamiella sorbophila]PRT53392.1 Uncharacterized protein C16C4.16c [Wickerhamiella sorbophila]
MEIEPTQPSILVPEGQNAVEQPQADDLAGDIEVDSEMQVEGGAEVRENSIFLSGVDDFSAKDVENFVLSFYKKPFYMEWVDDSSLNVVYDDAEDAFQCLVALTSEEEFSKSERIEPTQLRLTKPDPKCGVSLKARFSMSTDKKVQKARERSRFYLMNGEPTRKEDIVRFGSNRSGAYKYGTRDQDLLGGDRHGHRHGSELFPSKLKNKAISANDSQVLKERAKEPDLFAHKIGSRSRNRRKRNDRKKKPSSPGAPSVYSNMDY